MKSGVAQKVGDLGSQVRPMRFRLIQLSRLLVMALFIVAALAALIAFFNTVSARQIETLDDLAFAEKIKSLKVKRQSSAELEALAQRALDTYPPQIDFAEQANTELARRVTPCLSCENRIVFIDQYKNNALTERGLQALSRSYLLSPYGDEELMKWRLQISSRHWANLDEEQRKATLRQITALAASPEHQEWVVSDFQTSVPDILVRVNRLKAPSSNAP